MADKQPMAEHVDVLKQFVDNLQLVIVQIQDDHSCRPEDDDATPFDVDAYWTRLGAIYRGLSAEATKLSLAFSSPPPPTKKQCEPLLGSLQGVILALVSAYYSLPLSQGLTLRKALQNSVLEIVQQVKSLVQNVAHFTAGSSEQLQTTGQVWQQADSFPSLPKDNKEASLAVVADTSELVTDALQELHEAVHCEEVADFNEMQERADDEPEVSWSAEDKTLVVSCTGLIKTVKSLLKKTESAVKSQGSCQSKMAVEVLDKVVEAVIRLSPLVDDLAASLYPPISDEVVREHSNTLSSEIANHLSFMRYSYLTTEDDEQWIDFLMKANEHNLNKIVKLTSNAP
ncbi:cyclin-D1-binding protein 1 homolog [Gigantopelta aegis]|uniref:cyclin-D1-binding protein 1 homolog n=1 Tax=Gigantopelta aegis TaxID=1735272 RepID=UPI001B88960F|nr:cyclin-D1-binding protein 1 homolog [Gigantopelta aegis]